MQSSTARRERLVSPLSLAMMLGLFALAFFVLRPESVPGTALVEVTGDSSSAPGSIDELSLAYLRAQKQAGKVDDAELARVVARLVRNDRLDEARRMLVEYPSLDVGELILFELDLAEAASESDVSLFAALSRLIDTPRLHQADLLERAVNLGRRLSQPVMIADLYTLWADSAGTAETSYRRYRRCGQELAALDHAVPALDCYGQALEHAPGDADIVDSRLAMLPLTRAGSVQQQTLVRDLVETASMTPVQRSRLADLLLQVERPDMAYRMYARLAVDEPEKSAHWLPLAARWAEAAGKPAEAAVFLDALLNDTGSN
ncbi:MAG: hypothetical protein HKN42_02405, partial [Granulosicoccus sp.]|nr:hypothetical protein [Granulosicoccus sp.]